MRTHFYRLSLLALIPLLLTSACFADPAYTSPEGAEEADEDFAYQGEYEGTLGEGEDQSTVAVQVIAQGDNKFIMKLLDNGLAGENVRSRFSTISVDREGDVFPHPEERHRIEIVDGVLTAYTSSNNVQFVLQKVLRTSPTLGAEPPEGAIVLFDGTNLDHWQQGAEMTDDGLLKEGCTSTDEFGSHQMHLEFLLPYMPEDSGQDRANSGCYVQGRYEIQILDSFGLEGLENECGGIYNLAAPSVNMCFPPLTWQTYDFDFHAAQYNEAGELVAHPRMTVRHNGVVIHDDLELTEGTPGGTQVTGVGPGPVFLQNHGNPVRFRNIWVLPLEE